MLMKMTPQQTGNTSTYLGIVGSVRCPRWRDENRNQVSVCWFIFKQPQSNKSELTYYHTTQIVQFTILKSNLV